MPSRMYVCYIYFSLLLLRRSICFSGKNYKNYKLMPLNLVVVACVCLCIFSWHFQFFSAILSAFVYFICVQKLPRLLQQPQLSLHREEYKNMLFIIISKNSFLLRPWQKEELYFMYILSPKKAKKTS